MPLKPLLRASAFRLDPAVALMFLLAAATAETAQTITDSGFEQGMSGWTETDPDKKTVSISREASSGCSSVKIVNKSGNVAQTVNLLPNKNYKLSADIKGGGVIYVAH